MTTRLQEVELALEAAGPVGDWASGGDEVYAGSKETYREICRMLQDECADDAELIAVGINALPDLLAVARAAEAYAAWFGYPLRGIDPRLDALVDALAPLTEPRA